MEIDTKSQLNRLIFATSNFPSLRGLEIVPFCLFFFAGPLLGRLSLTHSRWGSVGLLVAFAAAIAGTAKVRRFYDGRYGKVETDKRARFAVLLGVTAYFAVLFACYTMDGLHPQFSLVALWIAAGFFAVYTSSAGYRWHYLVLAVCFALLVPRWGGLEPGGIWQSTVLAGALLVGGVLDHILLVRMLPGQKGEPLSRGIQ